MLEFAESGHPIFRATSPLSRGQLERKGHGKLSIHCCADLETIETVFRTIVSVNQLSLYGAVAQICEKYETFHDRTGRPVARGQSSSGFLNVVEIGQYFITKDTEEFSQFTNTVACREYTLPRDMKKHRNQKVGSEEIPKLAPCWKLQLVSCTVSAELRSELCPQMKTVLSGQNLSWL